MKVQLKMWVNIIVMVTCYFLFHYVSAQQEMARQLEYYVLPWYFTPLIGVSIIAGLISAAGSLTFFVVLTTKDE